MIRGRARPGKKFWPRQRPFQISLLKPFCYRRPLPNPFSYGLEFSISLPFSKFSNQRGIPFVLPSTADGNSRAAHEIAEPVRRPVAGDNRAVLYKRARGGFFPYPRRVRWITKRCDG